MRRVAGTTLVELLVACALIALVAGTAAAVLAGGLHVWERMRENGAHAQWMDLAIQQMRNDLRSVCRFEPIPFEGRSDAFSYPSRVEVRDGDAVWHEIGVTSYFLDRRSRQWRRAQLPYRAMRRTRLRESGKAVADNVERVSLRYYHFNRNAGTYQWRSSWSSVEPPLAVLIELQSLGTAGRATATSCFLYIPTAPGHESGSGGEPSGGET